MKSAGVTRDDSVEGLIAEVPINRIQPGFPLRALIEDPDHVRLLAEVHEDLPPVLVHRDTMRLLDGVHRVAVARLMGRTTISATYFDGNEEAALLQAVRCNTSHGKPLTSTERLRVAAMLFERHPEWSDRRIAAACGLSPKTVGVHRPSDEGRRARIGRDGKSRPVDPARQREDIAAKLRANSNTPLTTVAEATGSSKATVRDVRERLRRGEDPLPARYRTTTEEASPPEDNPSWREDTACRSQPDSSAFAAWMDDRRITRFEWRSFADVVPLSRVYMAITAAREQANEWEQFADALDARVRARSARGGGRRRA